MTLAHARIPVALVVATLPGVATVVSAGEATVHRAAPFVRVERLAISESLELGPTCVPVCSPTDANLIAFEAYTQDTPVHVYLHNRTDGSTHDLGEGCGVTWSPDGVRLAHLRSEEGAHFGVCTIWDVPSRAEVSGLLIPTACNRLYWSPAGDYVAAGTWSRDPDKYYAMPPCDVGPHHVALARVADGVCERIVRLGEDPLRGLARSQDGCRIAYPVRGRQRAGLVVRMRVTDVEQRKSKLLPPRVFCPLDIECPANWFSLDGGSVWCVVVRRNKGDTPHLLAQRWEVETGRLLQELGPDFDPLWLTLSPDGRMLACLAWERGTNKYDRGRVQIIDAETGQPLPWERPVEDAWGLSWGPSGETLAFATADGLWMATIGAAVSSPNQARRRRE